MDAIIRKIIRCDYFLVYGIYGIPYTMAYNRGYAIGLCLIIILILFSKTSRQSVKIEPFTQIADVKPGYYRIHHTSNNKCLQFDRGQLVIAPCNNNIPIVWYYSQQQTLKPANQLDQCLEWNVQRSRFEMVKCQNSRWNVTALGEIYNQTGKMVLGQWDTVEIVPYSKSDVHDRWYFEKVGKPSKTSPQQLNQPQCTELEKQVQDLKQELKKCDYKIQIARETKCPPRESCLPYIQSGPAVPTKSTITKCPACPTRPKCPTCPKCPLPKPNTDSEKDVLILRLKKELKRCRNQFVYESFINSSSNDIDIDPQMDVEKITTCTLRKTDAPSGPKYRYDITQHKDFKRLVAKMMLKSQCAVKKSDIDQYIKKSECKLPPIAQHPDIDKYILKTQIPKCELHECQKHFVSNQK